MFLLVSKEKGKSNMSSYYAYVAEILVRQRQEQLAAVTAKPNGVAPRRPRSSWRVWSRPTRTKLVSRRHAAVTSSQS
jgi:hypothetical protein